MRDAVMGPSLDEIATAGFRATASAHSAAKELKDALGFGAFNVPARLAIARSLAIPEPPKMPDGEPGMTIKGETLFGSNVELATWVSLFIEYYGKTPESLAEFQTWVRAHWTRGARLLHELLEEADRDTGRFWRRLAETALPERDETGEGPEEPGEPGPEPVPTPIAVSLGTDMATGENVVWRVNAPGSAPHAALMGASGKGKTRCAIDLLHAIREATPVPLLAFDFKPDLTEPDKALDRIFDATVISPRDAPIPLDVLHLPERSPNAITLAAQKLRDTLGQLKGSGFGAIQKSLFVQAAEQALRTHVPCTLAHVRDALNALYQQQGRNPDGATSTLEELCRLPLFEPKLSPAEFFSRSWIVQLPGELPEQVRVAVAVLLTDALDRHLSRLGDAPTDPEGHRALRVLCVIDEAHRILETHLPGLVNLLRVSRSRGGAVMLISQRPDDFDAAEDDFLADMSLVLSFETNAKARSVARLFGSRANLATLGRGEAWVKLGGEPAARRVRIWS